jgi:hypothetical protein
MLTHPVCATAALLLFSSVVPGQDLTRQNRDNLNKSVRYD